MIGSYCHLLSRGHKTHFITFVSLLESPESTIVLVLSPVCPRNISDILLFYPFSRSWTVCQDPAKTQHDTSSPTQLLSTTCLALSSRCLEILSWTVASCPDAVQRQSWLLPFEFAAHLSISECTQNKVTGTILCKNGPLPSLLAGDYPNYPGHHRFKSSALRHRLVS